MPTPLCTFGLGAQARHTHYTAAARVAACLRRLFVQMISDLSEVSVAGKALFSCLSGMEMRAKYQGSSASDYERLRLLTGPGQSLGMATWCHQETQRA